MLATQLNHYITNNEVVANGVIQLDRYICNAVSGIKIIIILGVTVISGAVDPIGDPSQVSKEEQSASAVPAAAPAQAPAAMKPAANNPYAAKKSSNAAPRGGECKQKGNIKIAPECCCSKRTWH